MDKPAQWAVRPELTAFPHLWDNTVVSLPFWDSIYEHSSDKTLTLEGGSQSFGTTSDGRGIQIRPSSNQQYYISSAEDWLPTDGVTIIVKRKKIGANVQSALLGVRSSGGDHTARCMAHAPWSDGNIYFDFGGASGSNRLTISGLSFGNDTFVFRAGSLGMAVWQNGVLAGSNSTSVSRTNVSGQNFGIGNTYGISSTSGAYAAGDVDVEFFHVIAGELPDETCSLLSSDPFLLIRPDPTKVLPYYVNTSSGTTIAAGVAEMPMSAVAGHLSAAATLTAGTANMPMTAGAGNVIRGTTLFAGVAEIPMIAISGVVSGVFATPSNAARRLGMTPSVSLGNRRLN